MRVAQAYRTKDPKRIAEARRELAEQNITAAVERALAVAPPLTAAQIERLSRLLHGGAR